MAGNYPPGVHAGTPNAPWNDEAPETCDECGGIYAYDGHETVVAPPEADEDEMACPNDGMTMADLEDARAGQAAEREYERMQEKRAFDQ